MARLKMRSIKSDSLLRKIALSFILTSILPILAIIYFVYSSSGIDFQTEAFMKVTIPLLVTSALAGLEIIRRIIKSVLLINRGAKAIVEGNTASEKIEVDEENEIKELALSFNRITKQLQTNIKELEKSKALLQDIVLKVGEAIMSFEDIDKFLHLIVETMTNSLRARKASLFLIEPGGKQLSVKVSYGQAIADKKIIVGEGLIGSVAKSGKALLVPVIEDEASFMAVPLKYGNRVIGVFTVQEKDENKAFNKDDLILLSELANQTASAIENHRLHKDAESTYIQTISALAMAVEARDPYTRGHSKRMAEYSLCLADAFSLDEKSKKLLSDACVLHDVGKIGTSDEILRKANRLSKPELDMIREHPRIGENILKPIASLRPLCNIVRHHHEWIDGTGYPDGLKGDEISLMTKILTVVDAFDAMVSNRPYRKAMSSKEAKEELLKYAGKHFDKEVVDRFINLI
ncbi:MAG: HD domain-containing protein [Candidatus Omnitrophica bacterium]|nr:HD domain-containing protein [Candidatus Omnitrophota bacterium]